MRESDYSTSIPKKTDLNVDAPAVPYNYIKPFNIETQSHQTQIGNKDYLNIPHYFSECENNSYRNIASPPHVNLNLLYSNINANKRDSVINVSSTMRVRNKFVTYIYYNPIRNKI